MTKLRFWRGVRAQISAPKIAIISMLLALLITLKYALGFIPGIELVSFSFIFLGIFLPLIDLSLLIFSFNILVLIVYGFGSWWIVYWIIWPLDALVAKLIAKFTRNTYVFAAWGFMAGLLVCWWYFLADLCLFGHTYALLNIISALPINLIEGLTTMVAFMIIAPPLNRVFNQFQTKFWNDTKSWSLARPQNILLNQVVLTTCIIAALAGIVLLFIFNNVFLDWKSAMTPHHHGYIPGGSGYDPFHT